jgi:hypothetical protein
MADFVETLLKKCDEALAEVEAIYKRDVASHVLSDDLLYKIRSVVQDCQSALDATASRVKEKYLKQSDWKPYFPLVADPENFTAELEKQLNGLSQAEPAVAAAFERHQPYQPGKRELGYLHVLSRTNKHSDFSEQRRTETREIKSGPGGGFVGSPGGAGIAMGEGAAIRLGEGASIRLGGPGPFVMHNMTQTVLVGWNFLDPPVPVLATLLALVQQTHDAVADIRDKAGL